VAEPKNFSSALKKRNALYKKMVTIEKQFKTLQKQVIDMDNWCNHYKDFGDKWEPIFETRINFSGYED